ncbi:MAG TPA: photosystem I reaction center subunit II, partial [Coleofasciculaceae cyanobacterium]
RPYVGKIERNIGRNPEPATLKFSGKKTYDA